jgi:hypothetical protein
MVWSGGGRMINRENPKNSEKNLLECRFVHHKSHVKSPGIEPEALW